uniref:2-Cys Prx B (2-Cysteine peroxiredoxin B) n=1 Tax=Arundo donax TaxID=35708 RepID=A0A0A8ZI31_ARUDO
MAPDFEAEAAFDQQFTQGQAFWLHWEEVCVIIFFYPLDATFVCPTEINSF